MIASSGQTLKLNQTVWNVCRIVGQEKLCSVTWGQIATWGWTSDNRVWSAYSLSWLLLSALHFPSLSAHFTVTFLFRGSSEALVSFTDSQPAQFGCNYRLDAQVEVLFAVQQISQERTPFSGGQLPHCPKVQHAPFPWPNIIALQPLVAPGPAFFPESISLLHEALVF